MAGMALAAVNPTVELVWSDMEKDYDSDPLLELAGIRLEIRPVNSTTAILDETLNPETTHVGIEIGTIGYYVARVTPIVYDAYTDTTSLALAGTWYQIYVPSITQATIAAEHVPVFGLNNGEIIWYNSSGYLAESQWMIEADFSATGDYNTSILVEKRWTSITTTNGATERFEPKFAYRAYSSSYLTGHEWGGHRFTNSSLRHTRYNTTIQEEFESSLTLSYSF